MPGLAVPPHHVAQKSMSTGVLLLRTCSSKSASLTLPTQTGFNTASLFGLPALWVGQGKEPRRDRLRGDRMGQVRYAHFRVYIPCWHMTVFMLTSDRGMTWKFMLKLKCLASAPDIRSEMGWAHQTSCRVSRRQCQHTAGLHAGNAIHAPVKALHPGSPRSPLQTQSVRLGCLVGQHKQACRH